MTKVSRRKKFKSGLHPLYLPYYEAICQKLPLYWQPFFGYRSFEVQDELHKIGREFPGKIVTNAKGGESAHNYGCASDWTIWHDGKPVWMSTDDPRWKEYSDVCQEIGLRCGS